MKIPKDVDYVILLPKREWNNKLDKKKIIAYIITDIFVDNGYFCKPDIFKEQKLFEDIEIMRPEQHHNIPDHE